MAQLDTRPYPPGTYPVIVVGSGPGGLQMSEALRRWRIAHAVLSADAEPGGMFLRYPLFQRLNTWTKRHPPAPRGSAPYAWYDWNSPLSADPAADGIVAEFMDGTSYFPWRHEMQRGLAAFAERARIDVRYGCRWTATRREPDGFTLETTDGAYRCGAVIFAIGMAEPWRPDIPGLESAPHYADVRAASEYAGREVFIVGKRTSAFEMADALLPWASRIYMASPRPATFTVQTHGISGVRARYVLPYEDALFGGGVFLFNTTIERVSRAGDRWRVQTALDDHPVLEVDDVVAATGWTTALLDLPRLGVSTFSHGRLIRMTPWWESSGAPGIYFAGTTTQGALGLRKHGVGSNSPAVAGARHNARALAAHLARTRHGVDTRRPIADRAEIAPLLLREASQSPVLWNQQSYLARVITLDAAQGAFDEGVEPLAHFVDAPGPDAVAVVLETDERGDHHPAIYLRRGGRVSEHVLPGHAFYNFSTPEHARALASILHGLV